MVTEAQIELAARTAHNVNRAYCRGLGDESQPMWSKASDWQRESALVGVRAIVADPKLGPEASHEGWLAQKEADGWRYGEIKDVEAKTHPCMVAYDDLPLEQRAKDALFGATVRGVLGLD